MSAEPIEVNDLRVLHFCLLLWVVNLEILWGWAAFKASFQLVVRNYYRGLIMGIESNIHIGKVVRIMLDPIFENQGMPWTMHVTVVCD